MGITLGTNINVTKAISRLGRSSEALSTTFERLSSGQRITRASDDAAGLAIASTLNLKNRVYGQAIRNINDGISVLAIAQGGLQQLNDIVTRISELAEQAATQTLSGRQRVSLDKEGTALTNEYNRIIQSTSFNGVAVFDGSEDPICIQQGFGIEQSLQLDVGEALGKQAGDGTFQAATTWDGAFGLIRGQGLGDFNRDGKADIIVTDNSTSQGLLLGNGDGTFQAKISFRVSPGALGIIYDAVVADYNGDGIDDAALGQSGNGIIDILISNGNGTFRDPVSLQANPFKVATGDFNGDGIVDLVAAESTLNRLSVFLGNGNGTFRGPAILTSTSNTTDVAIGDFNGDGLQDLASVDTVIAIYSGNGDGTFGARKTATGVLGNSVLVADFNRDGIDDIGSRGFLSAAFVTYLGRGNGTFAVGATATTGVNPTEHDIADLNGDNIVDLVITDSSSSTVSVLIGNGDGTFKARNAFSGGSNPAGLQTADFNRDGVTDFFISDYTTGKSFVYLGNADATGRRNNQIAGS